MFFKNALSRIFARIFISTLCVCALVAATIATGTFLMFDAFYGKSLKKYLADSSSMITASIRAKESFETISAISAEFARESGIRTTVVSSDGKIVFDTDADQSEMANHLNRPEVAQALAGKRAYASRYSNTLNAQMLYLAVPAGEMSDGAYAYCVRLAVPQHNLDFAKNLLLKEIVALSLVAVLFSAAVSWILARRISKPMNRLGEHAREFASGNFDSRVEESDIHEISQLGRSMSEMARQLKKRMSSLHKRNCELDEIFSHMSECVLICTDEGVLLKANTAARKIFGIKPPDVLRPEVASVIQNRHLLSAIAKTFADGTGVACDIDAGGKVMALESVLLPYESRTRRALFVMRDVSIARDAEVRRREFVAGVSHELRTPVAGIMGAAEIIMDGADSGETAKLVAIIARDSKRMNALVEDMLALSSMETPEYVSTLKFETADICRIIGEVCATYEHEAAKRGQTVLFTCEGPLEAKVDAALVSLAVSNLVGNALKYSFEKSQITVGVADAGSHIEIFVSDDGPGMEPEHCERVFERFYRVEKGRPRQLGGSGIGLAIVKHVAIVHGGKASVESAPGRGSTFKITLKKDAQNG